MQVYQGESGINTNYTLGLSAQLPPIDNAGNTLALARNLGTLTAVTQNFSDFVGVADANDFYKFTLDGTRNLRLNLSGLSADADVKVFSANGTAMLGSGTSSNTSTETVNLDNLAAGTYYVQVYPGVSGINTNYTLGLSAQVPTPPVISISSTGPNTIKSEGNSGSTPFTFTVSRSSGTGTSTVAYAVTGAVDASHSAVAASASDFAGGVLPGGTINFAAGETSKTLTINVAGDTILESAERFNVTLSAPTNATLGNSLDYDIINNDDVAAAPMISISSTSLNTIKGEGNSGSTPFTFTVSRSSGTGTSTVAYAVTGAVDASHSAVAASANDFAGGVLPGGTISFGAGETSKTLTINVAGDTALESAERFNVTLSAPTNATLGTKTDFGIISNDDSILSSIYRNVAVFASGVESAADWSHDAIKSYLKTQYDSGQKYWLSISGDIDVAEAATFGFVSLGPEAKVNVYVDIADLIGVTPEGRDGKVTVRIEAGGSLFTIGAGWGSPIGIVASSIDYRSPDGSWWDASASVDSVDFGPISVSLGPLGMSTEINPGNGSAEAKLSIVSIKTSTGFEYDWQYVSNKLNSLINLSTGNTFTDAAFKAVALSLIPGAVGITGMRPLTGSDGTQGTPNQDTLLGTTQNDAFNGHNGNDKIYGYAGNDSFEGGLGNDTMYGGSGDDIYRYYRDEGNDTIDESGSFTSTESSIDLLEIRDNSSLVDLDNFNDLRFKKVGSDLVINLDIQGSAFTSDFNSGSVTIKNQGGLDPVELLKIFDDNGDLVTGAIDLSSVWLAAGSSFTTLNFVLDTTNTATNLYIAEALHY